jgi:uncharacterized protein (TIGR04255 family)
VSTSPPYVSDTLRWVAAEVKYPPVDQLAANVPPALRERVEADFPILESATQLTITVGQQPQQAIVHRFLRRDRLMSLTFTRDSLALETSAYPGWTSFSQLFVAMVTALQDLIRPAGIVRIGLRYIDEVRLPEPPVDVQGWQGWLDDRLVAPFLLSDNDRAPSAGTVVLQFGTAPGQVTVFRAAPVISGRAVQEEGPLRMPFRTPDTAYFLLDTDASWTDPARLVPEFAAQPIAQILDELHTPCHNLFEMVITPRLRTEVLMRPREDPDA